MPHIFERLLIGLGRHVRPEDRKYWAYMLLAFVTGAAVVLATGLWGLGGLTLAAYGLFAILARKRYEASVED